MAAIRDAALRGYPYVEVDVVMSSDHALIPSHFEDLDVFSTCAGRVDDFSTASLSTCQYLDEPGTSLTPIEQGLDGVTFRGFFLDMKFTIRDIADVDVTQSVDVVTALDSRLGHPNWLVAMSYDPDVARGLIDAGIRTGYKGYPAPEEALAFVEEAGAIGAEMACFEASSLSPEVASRVRVSSASG